MSNKDDHLIYESYSNPSADNDTPNDVVYETIEQTLNILEGKGIVVRPKFSSKELYNILLKPRHKEQERREVKVDDEDEEEKEERKREMIRAISLAGDADYNMPFEEGEDHEDEEEIEEGSEGTQSDREKADVDDDGDIEPWEKKRANAIRSNQGKPHLCAKTVNHESYGPGHTVHARHAHPDVNGNIAWYVCEFKHGTEVINTEDMEIVTVVEHSH